MAWQRNVPQELGGIARFSELSVSIINPDVRRSGNTAVAEIVKGKRADNGAAVEFAALTTNVYEKRDGRWLMVHHHGSRWQLEGLSRSSGVVARQA